MEPNDYPLPGDTALVRLVKTVAMSVFVCGILLGPIDTGLTLLVHRFKVMPTSGRVVWSIMSFMWIILFFVPSHEPISGYLFVIGYIAQFALFLSSLVILVQRIEPSIPSTYPVWDWVGIVFVIFGFFLPIIELVPLFIY